MKRSKSQLFYMLTGLVVVLGGGFSYFIWSGMESKAMEIVSLKKDTRDPKELEAELSGIREQREQHAATLAHLEKGIPEMAYVPTMLKELESFGKQNGIDVRGVRPVPVAKDPKKKSKPKPYNELTIEVKGKGKYRAVMNFISALKNFPKIVACRTVALTPKNEANAPVNGNLEVVVELRAFLFKPEKDEFIPQEEPDTQLKTEPTNNEPVRSGESGQGSTTEVKPVTTAKGF